MVLFQPVLVALRRSLSRGGKCGGRSVLEPSQLCWSPCDVSSVSSLTEEEDRNMEEKFRLYLKRLSGVAQQQNPFSNALCGASSNAKLGQLGRLDFQTMAVSGQISPQTLAALQDELLGRPSRSLTVPSMNQPIVQQALVQGNSCVSFERGITFGQPLLKGQELSSFPVWSSNNLGIVGSSNNLGGLDASQNSNMLMAMLPQSHSRTISSESNHAINVQPSCLVSPTKPSDSFQVEMNPMLNRDPAVVPTQFSGSYQAGNAIAPMTQDSVVVPQSSTSMKMEKNDVTNLRSTILPSQSYTSVSLGNNPRLLNYGSVKIPCQQANKSQSGKTFLMNHNSLVVPSQSSSTLKTQRDDLVNHNSTRNKDSTHFNYNRLPTKPNVVTSSMAQILDGDFHNLAAAGYSAPETNTSDILSSTGSNISWQLASSKSIISQSNVHDFCNVQAADTMSVILSDKGEGKNLGFVGKGTCLPSRFAVDDIESPTNEWTNGITYTGDDAYFLNQDVYGALQSGPCATTSYK